jgi:uncharacterized membrane protein YqgA involved in biofilm formation|tara:strand:+ start:448 stop:1134 length:687 start_codon:yes stop_codon:yes gene_type:complete
MIIPIGSIVNALAVIIGSLIGLKFGSLVSPKIKTAIFQVIGLFTLVLGLKMALATQEFLLLLICLVLGAIIGEALSIDKSLTSLGDFLKDKLKSKNPNFTEGLLTAFLLYCVGSMTFVGAIEEGINQDTTLLFTKSLLDGITSILLASTFGIGVLISAIPLLIFQTILTWGALFFEPYLSTEIINEISAVGGVLIIALSLNILELKKIKVSNLLPALFLVIPLYYLCN